MDLVFSCPNCRQELEADADGAGTEIACPQCAFRIVIPEPTPQNIRIVPAGAAAAKAAGAPASKERHLTLPVSDKKVKIDIARPKPSLEMEAKGLGKKTHLKCFRHADFAAQGTGHFDQAVSDFLQSLGENCLISAHPIQYSYVDPASKQVLADFGVMICYKS